MSYKTLEVELENGRVHPTGSEALPVRAHALLTLLDPAAQGDCAPALTCAELADRWERLEKLPPEEAAAFADDLERGRASLLPLESKWV